VANTRCGLTSSLQLSLHRYGHPPPEIMKELAPELQLDKDGMPIIEDGGGGMPAGMPPFPFMSMPGGKGPSDDPDDCCIM
jgi:hypothetical protein